ncbi:FlgN protein [Natronincola peptidivorans]|uniref:FlgN protein n=1 Tax=Natronincola peptidivorans TaxID=426128 RepID=A0A1H9ZW24_9FIRM|nr:flagellar protein FlgN [Natronincola peptidivorans]SES85984.1 FlgN protein [Natronincola peptidivorans]
MKTEEVTNYLLRLTEAKLVLMKDLLKVTTEQSRILQTDEVEMLDSLIQQKQVIIEKINVLDKEFAEKYEMLKKELGVANLQELEGEAAESFKDLKEKIEKVIEVIEEIHLLDHANTEKIKENIAAAKKNIKTIKTGKKAVSGYNSTYNEGHSIFMDKKK